MKPDIFGHPVTIPVGLGCPAAPSWMPTGILPNGRPQNGTPHIRSRSRHAVPRGEIEAETARGLFAAVAEKHDLLAPETNVIAAHACGGTGIRTCGEVVR
ncbi:hypothetical protein NXC12_PD00098 (plasmid) [Rhizobium etli]|uniref:Uncharacterized protein n=1 Tax=Rhizobium etli TaxID=29449 RepID=A0AAN1BLF3_RHIET|nr:hypothetical protein NXC12_PD00098 [Rhizobium etli]